MGVEYNEKISRSAEIGWIDWLFFYLTSQKGKNSERHIF